MQKKATRDKRQKTVYFIAVLDMFIVEIWFCEQTCVREICFLPETVVFCRCWCFSVHIFFGKMHTIV